MLMSRGCGCSGSVMLFAVLCLCIIYLAKTVVASGMKTMVSSSQPEIDKCEPQNWSGKYLKHSGAAMPDINGHSTPSLLREIRTPRALHQQPQHLATLQIGQIPNANPETQQRNYSSNKGRNLDLLTQHNAYPQPPMPDNKSLRGFGVQALK